MLASFGVQGQKLIPIKHQTKNLNLFAKAIAVGIFHNNAPSRKGHNPAMAYEDRAAPSRTESSAIGNTQRRNGGTRKEHHNPQAGALQCPLDDFLTRYMESPNLRRKT